MSTLTLKILEDVRKKLPEAPPPRYHAVKPSCYAILRNEIPELKANAGAIFGVDVCVKPGQVMECWQFKDVKLFRKYLADEISEKDLIGLAISTNANSDE